MNIHGFNSEQLRGYNILMSRAHCFLTGDAGVGKSYMLVKFIEDSEDLGKNVVVVAPTGIAAININGSTIHRLLELGTEPLVYSLPMVKYTKVLLEADVLVLDEVSMCRLDLFDHLMMAIGKANKVRKEKGKKAIQIVLCGDFFQLPPVITDRDKDVLNEHYGYDINKGFAFQSKYWKAVGFVNIVLHEIIRQKDKHFSYVLNKTRMGDRSCLDDIQRGSSKTEILNAIYLLGTNKAVKEKNDAELDKIKSKSVVYEATIEGDVKESDKMTYDTLILKVGARVMTLINHPSDLYQNGSFGTVTECHEHYVKVLMDNGNLVNIRKHDWEIVSYSMKNHKGKSRLSAEVVGTFSQLPLKLAYAITVHKSQGQTYDAVNLNPYSWDCGQLYVALSRVKSLDKLYLTQPLYNKYLITSYEVKDFYRNLE